MSLGVLRPQVLQYVLSLRGPCIKVTKIIKILSFKTTFLILSEINSITLSRRTPDKCYHVNVHQLYDWLEQLVIRINAGPGDW